MSEILENSLTLSCPAKIWLTTESFPYSNHCQLNANNDLAAVNSWLSQFNKHATIRAYRREALRLLLWCQYERGCPLAQLKVEDLSNFISFLQDPLSPWAKDLEQKNLRLLFAPLKKPALEFTLRAVDSLLNYLVMADYLRANPFKLIKKKERRFLDEQRYQVWTRMLEEDEWSVVQNVLQNLPANTKLTIDNKLRTQFLFALLYLLGLRLGEVASHNWNAFRLREGRWWFFVKGKGDKLGHVPVNEQLLSYVKIYRLHLNKTPLPDPTEEESLFISLKTKNPLSSRQLHDLIKAVGRAAAQFFPPRSLKRKKLERFSAHWLRHLSASHQDRAGVPATMIQNNLRHGSLQTTQIYVHAEDVRRALEIEKLKMDVIPKITNIIVKEQPRILEVTLQGGPLCYELSLEQFINTLETVIFIDLNWTRLDFVISKHRAASVISYMVNNCVNWEIIKRAIISEAEIRLFNCTIKLKKVND